MKNLLTIIFLLCGLSLFILFLFADKFIESSERNKIIYSSFFTILSGVFILTIGQIIIKFIIEPIQKVDNLKLDIGKSLLFFCDLYTSLGQENCERRTEAKLTFRSQAHEIIMLPNSMVYRILVSLKVLPEKQDLQKVKQNLLKISNSVVMGFTNGGRKMIEEKGSILNEKNQKAADEIRYILRIETYGNPK